jgi:hypothetical protein
MSLRATPREHRRRAQEDVNRYRELRDTDRAIRKIVSRISLKTTSKEMEALHNRLFELESKKADVQAKITQDEVSWSQAEAKKKQRLAIATLFLYEHNSRVVFAAGISAAAFAVECFAQGLAVAATSWSTMLVASFAAVVALDNLLVRVRIKRRLFGGTEYEAREIVAFILRNSGDLGDGGGSRRIFDPIESEESLISEGYEVGSRA